MAGRVRPRNASSGRASLASTSAGRPSVSRRSSVVYGKTMPARVDNRPINDKGFQIASMRKLVDYLSTHGYGYPTSSKLLPSGKDIHNMIEFLIHQMDPNFRLIRLEDDVPFFFKTINYPFQISKSALYAAGSPHSWPNLLAALAWMVDLLICQEHEAGTKLQEESMLNHHELMVQSYKYFMQGNDEAISALDEEIQAQLFQVIQALQREAEQMAQQIMELDSKLQGLKSGPSPLVAMETKKSMLAADVGKFNTLIQNLITHKSSLEKKVEQHKQQTKTKEAELGILTAEIQALSRRISEQTVNVEDFEKMVRELQRFEEELQSAMARRKGKEKETWDFEVLWSKKFKQLEIVALDSKNAIKRLKLRSQDNSTAFEIQLNSRGETAHDLLGVIIKEHIRPQILALQEDIEKHAREKWNEATELLKENSVLEDGLKDKQASSSETRMKELEAVWKKKQETLESYQSAINKIQTQMEEDKQELNILKLEISGIYEKMKKEFEQAEGAVEQELKQEKAELLALMEGVTGFVEQIAARGSMVKDGLSELKEMVGNNYIRKLKS